MLRISSTLDRGQVDLEKNARLVYEITRDKLLELDQVEEVEVISTELKHNALETISKKILESFLAIHLDKLDKADRHLQDTRDFILRCQKEQLVAERYIPGIELVLDGLDALFVLQLPASGTSLVRMEVVLEKLLKGDVNSLDRFGQVGVLAMHSSFIGLVHNSKHSEQGEIIRRMIKLEPSSGLWKLWLHNVKRFERREVKSWTNAPGTEERQLIIEAAALDPTNPQVLTALCTTIGDVLKDHGPNWRGHEDFGTGRSFSSSEEMYSYIRKEMKRVLILDPTSVRTNIAAAQIFSVSVPKKFRDYHFAKICIDRALLFHPNSSKANQRMGIYLLNVEENPVGAIRYFEHAVKADPRNFPAVSDLIHTYLSNHDVNTDKIEQLLETELVKPNLSEGNVARLNFVKGVYFILKQKFDEGFDYWLTALKKKCHAEDFKRLDYFSKRYSWPSTLFSVTLVQRHLRSAIDKTTSREKKEELLKLLDLVTSSERQGGGSSYRGGRGRGSSSYRGNHFGRGGFFDGDGGFFGSHSSYGQKNYSKHSSYGDKFSGGGGGFHGNRGSDDRKAPVSKSEVDHYAVLGLKSGATQNEIKKAYKIMCLRHHPDKNGHLVGAAKEKNLETMKAINKAHDKLAK